MWAHQKLTQQTPPGLQEDPALLNPHLSSEATAKVRQTGSKVSLKAEKLNYARNN